MSDLHLYSNIGISGDFLDQPIDLHQYVNVGMPREGDPFVDTTFHQYLNVNNDQPHPTITHVEPADLLVPGETAVIDGYNFEGRNDGGDIQPKVYFYGLTVLAGWHVELEVIDWDINPVAGEIDHVTVLLPLQLPSTGYIIIVQEGPDKNPTQPYSNFWSVAVAVVITTLELIDFDDENVNIPLSQAWDSYWIGSASLDGKIYVTSKRAKPFSFDGTDVEILDISTFVDPLGTNEIQKVYNNAIGGTFKFTRGGDSSSIVAWDGDTNAVAMALKSLPGITAVTVTGTGTEADPWTITFTDPGSTNIGILTTDDTLLESLPGWDWVVDEGLIEGDPDYYTSGAATDAEYKHAVSTAYLACDDEQRIVFVNMVWSGGKAEGEKEYWYIRREDEVAYLADAYAGFDMSGGETTVVVYEVGGEPGEISNSFPRAFFAARKHDRLWAANIRYGDGTEHRSRVHYSDPVAPEAWWADSYVDFDPDDGQWITGLISYGEGLLVFKNRNVQLLTGMSQDSFSRQMLVNNTGTTSPYTIKVLGGVVYFMDRDSGVWSFDGAVFTPISEKIRTYLLAGINYDGMYTAAGYAFREKYVLSVPWGDSIFPNRTFVYDVDTQAWTEYDYGFRDAVEARGQIYGVAPRETAGAFRLGEGGDDHGTQIDAEFETPWIAPGGHSVKQRTKRIDMAFSNLGGAVTIGQYIDFDPTTPTHEATETVSDPSSDQVLQFIGGFSATRWESMQIKVKNVSGSDFQLNHVTVLWTSLRRNRGVTDV